MVQIKIDGRDTGRGAYTSVLEDLSQVDVQVVEMSGTGHHWTEIVRGGAGDEFSVIDISNSGKHNCYRACLTENNKYKIIEYAKINSDLKCSICKNAL